MNNCSQARKRRVRKASKVRKNSKIFGPKLFGLPLYLHNAALSKPIKRGSNGPADEMRKKRQKKREERERKRRKK